MIALLLMVLGLAWTPPDPPCIWDQSFLLGRGIIRIPDAMRASPKDSVTFSAGGATVKVCYSRPSLKGRTMIGGELVPYGQLWRTGANEATMIHTSGHLVIAGIHVDAGTYSLYTVPGEHEWEIIVNRAHMQWGHESTYTDSVRAMEVGRGRVPAQGVATPIERFTIRAEPGQGGDANLILEWQISRVAIPFNRMR
jgi:hypothetical protein